MIRVLHIITDLNAAGAEMMLYKLLYGMDRQRFSSVVISLMGKGVLGGRIEKLGIPVYHLDIPKGHVSLSALRHLVTLVRSSHADIIQGWMYHGNLAATIAKMLSSRDIPVLWNIRQTLYSLDHEKSLARFVIRLSCYFAKGVAGIIYNSNVSALQHEAMGYPRKARIEFPNGFDTSRFAPSDCARSTLREELGVGENTPIVSMFARYHPMKDHANFLRSAALILKSRPDTHFFLVGNGVTLDNMNLRDLVHASGAEGNFHLLGERQDIARLMAAVDINIVASAWGEGFPNVLGEAMACGVLCVATDIGDSALILGSTGIIVPAGDSQALADGVLSLLGMEKVQRLVLSRQARKRVIDNYAIANITDQYENLYSEIATNLTSVAM